MKQVDNRQLRLFGLSLSAAIFFWLLIYCWFTQTDLLTPWPVWLLIILLTDFALFKPAWLEKPFKVWMVLVEWLNKLITYTLLGSIFLLLITPIAIFKRLTGKDAMKNKKYLPDSYRITSQVSQAQDMEHPY